MNTSEPWQWSAQEIRTAIAAKAISAVAVTRAHLERIDAVNPRVNALVTLVPDRAFTQARNIDRMVAKGETLPALAGIPIAHKDLTLTKGIRTTFGSKLYADFLPTQDAEIIKRMRAAGAITLGKTNTPEWGAGSHTFNPIFGVTRNPYDLSKSAGGSSGGAAAALAARMIPIADGSDLGGSLRNPASFCNVVGFRTTAGRVPLLPTDAPNDPLPIVGPMARTVDDCALLLSVMAGPHPEAPLSEMKPEDYAPPIVPIGERTRIALSPDFNHQIPIEAEVSQVINSVAGLLRELKAHHEFACPDLSGAAHTFHVLRAAAFARKHGPGIRKNPADYKSTVVWNVEQGLALTSQQIHAAEQARELLTQRVHAFFNTYDFLLTPVVQVLPFDASLEFVKHINGQAMETYIQWMQSCSLISVTGLPALSLPCGFSETGLPVGLQIIGRPGSDLSVLRLARALETLNPVWQVEPSLETDLSQGAQ